MVSGVVKWLWLPLLRKAKFNQNQKSKNFWSPSSTVQCCMIILSALWVCQQVVNKPSPLSFPHLPTTDITIINNFANFQYGNYEWIHISVFLVFLLFCTLKIWNTSFSSMKQIFYLWFYCCIVNIHNRKELFDRVLSKMCARVKNKTKIKKQPLHLVMSVVRYSLPLFYFAGF